MVLKTRTTGRLRTVAPAIINCKIWALALIRAPTPSLPKTLLNLPHLSLRQQLTCFGGNGKRAQGRTISKHMDRRTAAAAPHSMTPRTHKQEPSKSTFRKWRIKTRLGWELTAKIFANLVRKTRSETCTRAAYTLSSKFETLVKKQHILIIIIPVSNAENKLDGSIKIRFSTTATSSLATTMDGWWLASFNKHRHAKTNPCQTLAFFKNAKSGRENRKVEVGWKWNQFLLQSKEPTSTLCFFGGVQLWEIENFA